jgi:hypothetical protein
MQHTIRRAVATTLSLAVLAGCTTDGRQANRRVELRLVPLTKS